MFTFMSLLRLYNLIEQLVVIILEQKVKHMNALLAKKKLKTKPITAQCAHMRSKLVDLTNKITEVQKQKAQLTEELA